MSKQGFPLFDKLSYYASYNNESVFEFNITQDGRRFSKLKIGVLMMK